MLNLHGISREAFDLIVEAEVSSRAAYDKKYRRPERPGGQSGVTVGIGYDCGYSTAATIRQDWSGKVPAAMVTALCGVAGLKGQAAQNALASVRSKVDIPWDAALDVFSNVSIPKYLGFTRKGLPGFDDLPADCKGVLLSLVYNRGASFQQAGSRYAEMRAIRAAVISGDLAQIPGLLRKMKRLWTTPSVRGVALRREEEARLFERGLKSAAAPVFAEPEAQAGPDGALILATKKKLDELGYHEFGRLDSEWGGRTVAAIAAYKLDRGMTGPAEIDDDLTAQLDQDIADGWRRPIADARSNATVNDLAPTNATLKQNWWTRLWAKLAAIPAGIGAVVSGAMDKFPDAKATYIDPVMDFFLDVPGWLWFVAAAGIAAAIWIGTRKADATVVDSFKTGRLLR